MTALLDFDWAVYRVCYGNKDFVQTIETIEWYIQDILDKTEVTDYRIFLTGDTNFRKDIATIQEYKGSRKNKPKPAFYWEIREHLINFWNAEISVNMEADDLCGIHQTEETIIVGEDKDLLMIPGWHYRIKKKWHENYRLYISEEESLFYFYKQLLVGDRGDDIPKIPKIGEVKANKLLLGKSNEARKQIVEGLYKEHFQDSWFSRFDEVGKLLWIKRDMDKEYHHYI